MTPVTKQQARAVLKDYSDWLWEQEKSENTINQYVRDVRQFLAGEDTEAVDRKCCLAYKQEMLKVFRAESVNTKISALNSFFRYINRPDLYLKRIRIQKKVFRSSQEELTKEEYLRLVEYAQAHRKETVSLVLQTICSTGIRVSELQYFTVEAVQDGEIIVYLKGKKRIVLLPDSLKRKLSAYIEKKNLKSGPVFQKGNGEPLDRHAVWRMMKSLCQGAMVDPQKVYPHNLRHLFAVEFHEIEPDIAVLADVLGHSSLNTTRIYIMSSGEKGRRVLDVMQLVCDHPQIEGQENAGRT